VSPYLSELMPKWTNLLDHIWKDTGHLGVARIFAAWVHFTLKVDDLFISDRSLNIHAYRLTS